MEEKAQGSFWKAVLIYGAILGVVGILLSVIFYLVNVQFAGWTRIVSLLVTVVILVYVLRQYREEYLGGFASYGKLLMMTLGIAVVATILSTIYLFVFLSYIDVEYLDKAQQYQIERFQNNPRISEAQLDTIMERIESRPATVARTMIWGVVGGVVFTFILGLIVSAFLKKEENPVSNSV